MQFNLESSCSSLEGIKFRTGVIKFNSNSSGNSIVSPNQQCFTLPLCLNYTRDGFIPHLTWDLLKYIPDKKVPILVSLGTIYGLLPVLKSCDTSLSNFISDDFRRSIVMVPQDVLVSRRLGFNSSKFIPIWTGSGRQNIYPKDLVECVKTFKPDVYQLLSDGETPKDSSNKRLDKSVQNTFRLAQEIFEIKEFDWKCKPILGAIEGGWSMQKRLISIEKTKSLPVDGFIIDGLLYSDLLDDSSENQRELHSLIQSICSELPTNKPRLLFGPLKPEIAMNLISAGVDIIDSSYCSYLTDKETALLINMQTENIFDLKSNLIDLNDDNLKEDFTPINDNCQCYTCSKGFTRAYLNHLIKTKEMLGPVLINLHNLFVYYDFINKIHSFLNSSKITE